MANTGSDESYKKIKNSKFQERRTGMETPSLALFHTE